MRYLLLTLALASIVLAGCKSDPPSTSAKSAIVPGAGDVQPGPGNAGADQRVGSQLGGK